MSNENFLTILHKTVGLESGNNVGVLAEICFMILIMGYKEVDQSGAKLKNLVSKK